MSGKPHITPGPWESDDTLKHYDHHVIRKNGMLICRMLELGYTSHGDRQANARLIATAPELLAALRDLVQRADTTEMHDGSSLETSQAHAVLAKLEGVE